MFENQSISNNPSVGNLIFVKNTILLFDKPLSFSSHKDRRKENKTECKKWTWIDKSHLSGVIKHLNFLKSI